MRLRIHPFIFYHHLSCTWGHEGKKQKYFPFPRILSFGKNKKTKTVVKPVVLHIAKVQEYETGRIMVWDLASCFISSPHALCLFVMVCRTLSTFTFVVYKVCVFNFALVFACSLRCLVYLYPSLPDVLTTFFVIWHKFMEFRFYV